MSNDMPAPLQPSGEVPDEIDDILYDYTVASRAPEGYGKGMDEAARRIRRLLLEARINTLKPYAEQFQSRTRQNQDQGGFEFYWGTKLLTEYKKLQHELQQLTDGGQE